LVLRNPPESPWKGGLSFDRQKWVKNGGKLATKPKR